MKKVLSRAIFGLAFISLSASAGSVKSDYISGIYLSSANIASVSLVGVGSNSTHPQVCQAMCIADSSCHGFSVNNTMCYLKGAVYPGDFTGNPAYISGTIR
jgi:hypothetical protein